MEQVVGNGARMLVQRHEPIERMAHQAYVEGAARERVMLSEGKVACDGAGKFGAITHRPGQFWRCRVGE